MKIKFALSSGKVLVYAIYDNSVIMVSQELCVKSSGPSPFRSCRII